MDDELKLVLCSIAAIVVFLLAGLGAITYGEVQRDKHCAELAKAGTDIRMVPRCMK